MTATISAGLLRVLAVGVLAAACAGPATGTRSNFTTAAGKDCMNHQVKPPSSEDRSNLQNVGTRLTLLRYYTAHGRQPFCDRRSATQIDLTWMRLYVAQGADASLVSRWLSP